MFEPSVDDIGNQKRQINGLTVEYLMSYHNNHALVGMIYTKWVVI